MKQLEKKLDQLETARNALIDLKKMDLESNIDTAIEEIEWVIIEIEEKIEEVSE